MMSGDGLVVRVRPEGGRLTREQALQLCEIATRHGSGVIDLTNRANLQLRGVTVEGYGEALAALQSGGLVAPDDPFESRRNIVVFPFWQPGDLTDRLRHALNERLPTFPGLPAKVGYSVDTGPAPVLHDVSADIRIERTGERLIVRADGVQRGCSVTEETAIDAVAEMAEWMAERITPEGGRMAKVVALHPLPEQWQNEQATEPEPTPEPHHHPLGRVVGVPFGQLDARTLAQAIETQGVTALRALPWRLMLFEGTDADLGPAFITGADDPLLRVDACPGAPFCASATVETRALARQLAPRMQGRLHVSGCAKGCAKSSASDITIVGREGRFDLVRDGRAWDEPVRTNLTPSDLTRL